MSKKFRKISVLILVPVLVCLLSITAFADSQWSDYRDYGSNYVDAFANITRYETSGTITSQEAGNNLYVGATYRYYPSGGASLVTEDEAAASSRYYAQVSFYNTGIHAMYNASYVFRADVYNPTGTDYWRPNTVVVTY